MEYTIEKWVAVNNGLIYAETPEGTKRELNYVNREMFNTLNDVLLGDPDISKGRGLAEFIRDKDLKEEIDSILFDHIGIAPRHHSKSPTAVVIVFKVTINRRRLIHDDATLNSLIKDFIEYQCSDGWGEAFEQYPFYLDNREEYYFDPYSNEYKSNVVFDQD